MVLILLGVFLLIAFISKSIITPKNKIQIWLASLLIPLVALTIFALIYSDGSYHTAGQGTAICLWPTLIAILVIYFQLKKKLVRGKNENSEADKNRTNRTNTALYRIITNPTFKKTIKEVMIGLVLFGLFTVAWLYLLSFIRGTDIANVFETAYTYTYTTTNGESGNRRSSAGYVSHSHVTNESTIFKAVFIMGEIFLIFLSKKIITKLIKFAEFIKKLK